MQYNGIELVEITEPQVFDPPKKMVVWDNDANKKECIVAAILPGVAYPVATIDVLGRLDGNYSHCAEIPEEPKPRRATNRELAKWLAQGNGQISKVEDGVLYTSSSWDYHREDDSFVKEEYRIRVRKWDDTDWNEPTIDYLGLE